MMRRAGLTATLTLLSAGLAGAAGPAALTPEDFAFVVPVQVNDTGRLARLKVPREVYLQSREPGLGDLRLFDPMGREVVHELRPTLAQSTLTWRPLKWTLLGAETSPSAGEFFLRREGNATEVRIVDGMAAAGAPPQWLIDLRGSPTGISRLRLQWPAQAQPFTHALEVEASDDLSRWRSVAEHAVLAEWSLDGARVVHDEVVIQPVSDGYLRLRLVHASGFELQGIEGGVSGSEPVAPYWLTLGAATAQRDGNAWVYDSGVRLPADRMQLALPDNLSSLPVRISSRPHTGARWLTRIEQSAYRLRMGETEITNPPWPVRQSDTLWRVEPRQQMPAAAPGLLLGWQPQALVFAPSLPGTYQLAFGRPGTPAPPDGLLSPLERDGRLPSPVGWLTGGPVRVQAAAAHLPPTETLWRTRILWLVLVCGVLLVGWLALRLVRSQSVSDGS